MRDIVVVSDLHLGRGKNPESGRHHHLEAFFYDDDFARFCAWLCEQATASKVDFKLILNGDTFDLLRINPVPAAGASASERRFGALLTPERAAATMADILAGHAGFVEALARVLNAGYDVLILPGNHDIEVQWAPVQAVIRQAIIERVRAIAGDAGAVTADRRLEFAPWFYYEPGRIWIEHGCQYDAENSFEYLLRDRLAELPDSIHEVEKDLPLGTFFQRYLYNAFGNITFIVPSSRAHLRYFRWLLVNKPRLLARVLTSHFPFFLQVIRHIAKAGGSTRVLSTVHDSRLTELEESSHLGAKLQRVAALKATHGTAAVVARGIILQILKVIGVAVLLALMVAGLWFAGFHAINEMEVGFGLKAIFFITLNFLFLTSVTVGVGYLLLRPPRGPPMRPMRRAARQIGAILDVPIVTFGHSHDEVVWRLKRPDGTTWYYNTGTWIAVFTHDQLLPRERVQYTFLRVHEDKAELMHWSPGRGESIPVILIEEGNRWGEPTRPTEAQAS